MTPDPNTDTAPPETPNGGAPQQPSKPPAADNRETPRIYAACLAAYNAGRLYGRWIDAAHGSDHVYAEIAAMLKASPIPDAEEWAIHDYEGFQGVRLEEYSGVERACALAAFISEYGALGAKLIDHHDGDIGAARAAFDDCAGCYARLADFAQSLTEDAGDIPERLAPYIDYEAMARDMVLGGDVYVIELSFEDVHVFWTR